MGLMRRWEGTCRDYSRQAVDGHMPDMVKTCYVLSLIVTVGRERQIEDRDKDDGGGGGGQRRHWSMLQMSVWVTKNYKRGLGVSQLSHIKSQLVQ